MEALKANLIYWLNPLKWTRQLVFVALLLLDFQHTYEFVIAHQTGTQATEMVPLFGPLFTWASIPMTNGVFDGLAYAFTITALIFFMSNTLAKRLTHNHPSKMYWAAMVVAILVSALTNAGTMYYGSTGASLIPDWLAGGTMASLGLIVTFGLLMFASMDAWEMKARIEKGRATRQRNHQQKVIEMSRSKFTPKKYRKPEVAA